MHRFLKVLLATTAAIALTACGGGDDPDQNLAQTVEARAQTDANPQGLSILLAAVQAADPSIAAALTGSARLTLFAPTNQAFANLLTELGVTRAQLFADQALLTQVLSYHVVSGEVPSSAVPIGKPITTIEGGIFKASASGATISLTDERNRQAQVAIADIRASNGVVHVVDRVILPGDKTIVGTAQSIADFSLLVEAVVAANLVATLDSAGPFTVFAPTNAAFSALLTELGVSKAQLFADTALLTRVLTYHVVSGRVLAADVPIGAPITTVEGGTFTVSNSLAVTDARGRTANITATDVLTRNGVIHIVDRVILPTP